MHVGQHVSVTQVDGVTRRGVIAAESPIPGMWIVDVTSDTGEHGWFLHHHTKITEESA